VVAPPKGPGIGIRAVWFLFIGWWLAGLVIAIAYICAVTVIGLPFAFLPVQPDSDRSDPARA